MFVFHMFAFALILKCIVTSAYSESQLNTLQSNLNGTTVEKNETSSKSTDTQFQGDSKTLPIIVAEGGAKIVLNETNTTERSDILMKITPTSLPKTYGREGEFTSSTDQSGLVNVTKENRNRTSSTSTEASKPVSESPAAEHLVTEETVTINTQTTKSHSRIVPKKGVQYTPTSSTSVDSSSTTATASSTTTTTTTTTGQPTTVAKKILKPTVTTGSEDEKDALVKEKTNNSTPKVPTIEYYQKKKEDSKRSSFIIPIVAVILSVPIVAILMNVLYKRCKEWWTHRHYSRMDFLIDGMYNN